MAQPGLYLLDGDLFVGAPVEGCFVAGKPGVKLHALKGHVLKAGTWKASGVVPVSRVTSAPPASFVARAAKAKAKPSTGGRTA